MTRDNKEYNSLIDDLQHYYELDLGNCLMTHKDWIEQIALLMTDEHYKAEILKEILEYQSDRGINI